MTLKKSSWHYRVWAWSHRTWNDPTGTREKAGKSVVPETTSLCPYFWRIILIAPLIGLWLAALAAVLICVFGVMMVFLAIFNIVGVVRARGYYTLVRDGSAGPVFELHRFNRMWQPGWRSLRRTLPLLYVLGGLWYWCGATEVLRWTSVAGRGVGTFTFGYMIPLLQDVVSSVATFTLTYGPWFAGGCIVVAALNSRRAGSFCWGVWRFFSEVVFPYMKAWYRRRCPLVEFEDDCPKVSV